MTFKDLKLELPILKALEKQGYTQPTPIQEQAIPILLKGHDLLGVAQTGTGKTAAFGIPILNHLLKENNSGQGKRKIKALVVTPTRELAIQIAENFTDYSQFTHLRNTVIFGGVKQSKQVASLQQGVDILVATPGRLLDLMNQGYITFRDLKYVVLDEADQMLDMGFIHDVKKIIAKLPPNRQSLFFSATMPKTIVELSQKMLGDFERVTIKPEQATAEKVKQGVYFVSKNNKPNLLIHLLEQRPQDSVLVFSRTKHGANKIVKTLDKAKIKSAAIHGNKSQAQRQKALGEFKDGSLKVLIATDIAARGIDVDDLALVINYDLPNVSETYVHRIGRTGRASASGIALSFCMGDERPYLKDIEKLIKQQVPRMGEHPYMEGADVVDGSLDKKPQGRNNNRNRPNNKNRNNNRNRNRN
ncbi:DEAD/DEAH box helicase [Flavobacteriaceae bacterium]|jgi:ATP-dependent RNA helicase RhlE|nr:DEAD/DEAH box helicase [Flavobacteriaceae bacterium]MBT4313968.1 DEAD/DEAH box helicase [Flavobacteriaceae bacterium]MBT5091118.1 DEAD/DEAH box helicase [Flavobacteriaceae bacterium]MBT5282705.1 DEAD/DEAH box helicase [Flavobacteriaceae bacterium]MBT5693743.1 DEAD/DEAH box helicase [Flavobacteriaceae bacterium]|tara:strand:+ start:19881 stop:21128 length:1248 start_codon:yes stop_codon:yes gene_type:complete